MSDTICTDSSSSCSPPLSPEIRSRPICVHKLPCVLSREYVGLDAGRTCWACSVKEYDDCEFFQWADGATPKSFCPGHCELRLKAEQQKYESQLHSKALVVEILTDQLAQCTGKIDYLEGRLQAALNEAECHKKRAYVMIKGAAIAAVLVTLIVRLM